MSLERRPHIRAITGPDHDAAPIGAVGLCEFGWLKDVGRSVTKNVGGHANTTAFEAWILAVSLHLKVIPCREQIDARAGRAFRQALPAAVLYLPAGEGGPECTN